MRNFGLHLTLLPPCRDDVPSPIDAQHDDTINTSTTTTPGRPHTGTSLDSSPATTDDESFRDIEAWNTVTTEMIQQLTEAEKKRQEIINGEFNSTIRRPVSHPTFLPELYETERNHVKILKVLHNVFMVPLEQSKAMTSELIQMVFPPSLLVLKEWHNSFESMLKQRWKEHNALIKEIGDCLNVVSSDVPAKIPIKSLIGTGFSSTVHLERC